MDNRERVREHLAALCHEQWSGWMRYLFSKCEATLPGTGKIIPQWAVDRWMRQATDTYAELTEEEKDSDRKMADRILAIIGPEIVRLQAIERAANTYCDEKFRTKLLIGGKKRQKLLNDYAVQLDAALSAQGKEK